MYQIQNFLIYKALKTDRREKDKFITIMGDFHNLLSVNDKQTKSHER